MKAARKWLPEQGSHFLHVLNGGGEEGLLAHVGVAAHAGIAKAVELFGIRERAFNRLFAPGVDVLARWRFRKSVRLIQIVLPNMPRHHLSLVTCCKTFCPSGARLTSFCIAAVLAKTFAARGGVLEQASFRADVAVECGIVLESIFAICAVGIGVSSIA